MILQDRGDHFLVIRQTDHAMLSGFLAREWGNAYSRRPDLFESFCFAVREHDNGWAEWEMAPQLDPKTRLPYTFLSIPTEDHVALYQRGIDRLVKVDPYAGLLVTMHCVGLYDRPRSATSDVSAKYIKSSDLQLVKEFLQGLRQLQARLKSDLRANPATKSLAEDASLERNTRLLQVLDRLSLYFCMRSPQDATIEAVPGDDASGEVDWELRPDYEDCVSLTPYAFRKSPLGVSILARRVPKRIYSSDADFQQTLVGAPYFALNFTLQAGKAALNKTQSAVA